VFYIFVSIKLGPITNEFLFSIIFFFIKKKRSYILYVMNVFFFFFIIRFYDTIILYDVVGNNPTPSRIELK